MTTPQKFVIFNPLKLTCIPKSRRFHDGIGLCYHTGNPNHYLVRKYVRKEVNQEGEDGSFIINLFLSYKGDVMKSNKVEVKSQGKVIGEVNVPEYENLKEAVSALTEERCISLINRQNKSDLTNEFRAAATRERSPMAVLASKAKTDPALAKKLEALISEYGGVPAAGAKDSK